MKRIILLISILLLLTSCTDGNKENSGEPGQNDFMAMIPYNFTDHETNLGFRDYVDRNDLEISLGIDVSSHNSEISWGQVKTTDIEFAIIRLGYRGYLDGNLNLDKYYTYNMEETEQYGIDNGIYFVTQATDSEEARQEASYILNKVSDYSLELPIVIDTEEVYSDDSRTSQLTSKERTDLLIILLDTIAEAGYQVSVYTNTYFLSNSLIPEQLGDYQLWLANYSDYPEAPIDFSMWQYSSEGFVNGIYGRVDLNVRFSE